MKTRIQQLVGKTTYEREQETVVSGKLAIRRTRRGSFNYRGLRLHQTHLFLAYSKMRSRKAWQIPVPFPGRNFLDIWLRLYTRSYVYVVRVFSFSLPSLQPRSSFPTESTILSTRERVRHTTVLIWFPDNQNSIRIHRQPRTRKVERTFRNDFIPLHGESSCVQKALSTSKWQWNARILKFSNLKETSIPRSESNCNESLIYYVSKI